MKKTKITEDMIKDYLNSGCHVHIRTSDEKGNKRITETILLIGIPCYSIPSYIREGFNFTSSDNLLVASRAFLSPKDRSSRRVSNEVVVGRIIRLLIDGRGYPHDFCLCDDRGDFQKWLREGVSPREPDIKKIAIFTYSVHPDEVDQNRVSISKYRSYIETEGRNENAMY